MATQISVNSGSQDISLEVSSPRQITVNAQTQTVDVVIEPRGNIDLTLSRAVSVTGVQQIVAGNNVTISPVGGTGIVTINSIQTGNVNYANTANYANYAGTAFNISGSNVSGEVANANYATYSGTAYSVSGSNVVGEVANANYATYSGNANIANTVSNATQSNITSLGTLTGLSIDGTITGNLIPTSNIFYDLGNNTNRFNDLYLSGSTIYIDDQTITANSTGISFSGNINGDGSQISNINGANVSEVANANYATNAGTAFSVAVGNVVGIGNIATINLDGNVSNVLLGNGVFGPTTGTVANANYATYAGEAFSITGSNVSGTVANANYASYAGEAFSVTGSNVSGAVANATHATNADSANSVAVANVSGIGNIATVNLDGNSGNILFGNGIFSAAPTVSNVANANYANFAGTAYSVAVANVSGIGNIATLNLDGNASNILFGNGVFSAAPNVDNANTANYANYANFAGTAFSVSGSNVSGTVANATHATVADSANSVTGANVVGDVAGANLANLATYATTANAVAGSNVSGQVSNALVSGTVYTNAQPNITSTGTLTSLSVTGNITGFANIAGDYILGNGAFLTGVGDFSAAQGYHGSFFSNVTQTAASTTTAYPITLNNTSAGTYGISVVSNSRVTFAYAGTYNIQYSFQFTNPTASIVNVNVWLRKNGTDVPDSNSQYAVLAKHGSIDGQLIAAINYIEDINANDYYELIWQTEDASVFIEYIAPGTTPTSPATPSAIVTAMQVTNVQAATLSGNLTGNLIGNSYGLTGTSFINIIGNISGNVFTGNGSGLTNLVGANVTGYVANANVANLANFATTANAVAGANVSGAVANATHANIADAANVAYSVTGANVSGTVANATYAVTAGEAYAVSAANIVGVINLANFATTANSVAGSNVSGEVNFASIANSVAGANVSGAVGLATFATTANAVAGANVSGTVANATHAVNSDSSNNVSGSNVSGAVGLATFATTANSVAVANVSGIGNIAVVNLTGSSSNVLYGNGVFAAVAGVSSASISNGTSNVNIPVANGDINISRGGVSNVVIVTGTGANVNGNIQASRFISNIATGTAPFTVTSTTQVANLTATTANLGNYVVASNITGNYQLAFVSTTINYGNGTFGANLAYNANIRANSVAGSLTANTFIGNLTGLASSATVAASANSVAGANVSGTVASATVAASANAVTGANVSGQVANALVAGTVYTNAQSNITSVGTLTTLDVSGNINGNSLLFVGFGANSSGFTNPVIVGKAGASQYVQAALVNSSDIGSSDWVAYADNGTNDNAWSDFGFTGSNFNDANYTITGKNDGYVFVQGDGANVNGGNLIFATGSQGSTKDIVFATGGFLTTDEKMRFIHSTGQFDIETTTAATTTSTGALRVRGGIGVAGNVVSGANVTASYFVGNGSALTGITSANANYSNFAGTAYSVDAANIVGTVNLANFATTANSVAVANVVGIGNIATTNYNGNGSQVLAGNGAWVAQSGGGGTPGGSNTYVQFNDGGVFGGTANLTFNKTTNTLSATNITGNGSGLTSLTGANVTGQVANSVLAEHVYNNSQPNITSTGTLVNLAVTSSSLSANTPVNFNQSWNNGSANFTVLRLNTTNTASDVSSKMLDIQVNTVSQFSVYANNYTDLGNVAYANYHTGNANISALNVSGVSNLNSVSNVIITGGTNGYVLSTNGSGNLSWVAQSGGGGSSETDFTPGFLLGGM